MNLINMPEAWAVQANAVGRTVVIADIDSGLAINHPDLVNRIQPGGEDFEQYNDQTIVNPVPIPITHDYQGHGTNTAGIMVAETNNAIGVASVGGWNQGGVSIKVLPIAILTIVTPDGEAETFESAEIAGINYAVSQGVDVINMSLGGIEAAPGDPIEHAAITAAYNAGITVVASAGNDTAQLGVDEDVYPAEFPEVIDVSACGPQRELSFFSDFGGNIAITAPGGDDPTFSDLNSLILSTYPMGLAAPYFETGADGYEADQGTSQAAPHVTGAIALLIACGAPRNPAQLKYIIQSTATTLDETPSFTGGNDFGAGLLNVYSAIKSLQPQFVEVAAAQSSNAVSTGGTATTATSSNQTLYAIRATTYNTPQNGLSIQYIAGLAPTTETDAERYTVVINSIQTTQYPGSYSMSYTGGLNGAKDFDIGVPASTPSSGVATTIVPRVGTLALPPGNYSATLEHDGIAQGVVFFDIAQQSYSVSGPTLIMFATPFTVDASVANPTQTLFGTSSVFELFRYNTLRTPPSGPTTDAVNNFNPYWEFDSSGTNDQPQASLSNTNSSSDGIPYSALQSSLPFTSGTASIAPVGLGYWLHLGDNGAEKVTLTPTGSTVAGPVAIRLFYNPNAAPAAAATSEPDGWNMIGDPYTYAVSWGAVSIQANGRNYSLTDAISAGIIDSALIGWVNGVSFSGYLFNIAPAGTLDPFNGYWVHVNQDCTLIIPPVAAGSSASTKAESPASRLPAIDGWRGRLIASVAGDRDTENYFGEAVAAKSEANQFDVQKPPTGGGHAYVRFEKADKKGRAATYAFDMRPVSAAHRAEWVAAVSTDKSNAQVTLSWDGLGIAPHDADFTLTDSATGSKVSLRSRSSYTFKSGEAGSTRSFKLTMTPRSSTGPLAIMNVGLVSGRAVQGVNLRLTTTKEADVQAVVKTLTGRSMASFTGSTRSLALTTTTLHWNGKSSDGASMPVGAYIIEITARTDDGETSTVKQVYTSLR